MFKFILLPNFMAKQKKEAADIAPNAEARIKEAARKLFSKHGFEGTKTRDIAQEAGINLALLNYYFRSKENLFEQLMMESMHEFIKGLASIVNNTELSLEDKLQAVVANYTQLFTAQPDLPLFVLSELRKNPKQLESNLGIRKVIIESHLFKQLKAAAPRKVNPFHLLVNTIGLTVFPYMASPMLMAIGDMDKAQYLKLMQERTKLIPQWIMLQLNQNKS